MELLKIRKIADKSVGQRVMRFDPETGESYLVNPATNKPEPWPLLGVKFEGKTPVKTTIGMRWVLQGVVEGWIKLVGEQIEHQPGGPPKNPWSKTHTFVQASQIIFKTIDGNVRYHVRQNPGVTSKNGTRSVNWIYHLELS